MTEILMLPEMLEAGIEALLESRQRQLDEKNTCIAIYLAMEGIKAIAFMREDSDKVH